MNSSTATLTDLDILVAEYRASKTLKSFFNLLDERRYEEQWDLMAEDGRWIRGDVEIGSREQFLREMSQRPADLIASHMLSNLVVDVIDHTRAEACFYALVFRHVGHRDGKPAPLEKPAAIFKCQARIDVANASRVSELRAEMLFVGE